MSPGMAYGQLGPTHHSIEDLAWMRVLPNLAVIVPADPVETAAAMRYSLEHEGPMFLRIARVPVPRVHGDDYEFRLGKAVQLREGSDVTLIACGLLVCRALDAARCARGAGHFGSRVEYEHRQAARSRGDCAMRPGPRAEL